MHLQFFIEVFWTWLVYILLQSWYVESRNYKREKKNICFLRCWRKLHGAFFVSAPIHLWWLVMQSNSMQPEDSLRCTASHIGHLFVHLILYIFIVCIDGPTCKWILPRIYWCPPNENCAINWIYHRSLWAYWTVELVASKERKGQLSDGGRHNNNRKIKKTTAHRFYAKRQAIYSNEIGYRCEFRVMALTFI